MENNSAEDKKVILLFLTRFSHDQALSFKSIYGKIYPKLYLRFIYILIALILINENIINVHLNNC